jgi:hypothetical protein
MARLRWSVGVKTELRKYLEIFLMFFCDLPGPV